MAHAFEFWTIAVILLLSSATAQDLIYRPSQETTVWEGQAQDIECEVTGWNRTPGQYWRSMPSGANYTLVQTTIDNRDGTFTSIQTLRIKAFTSQDAGKYICTFHKHEATVVLLIQPACEAGKYGIGCTSACSRFCRLSDKENDSLCHYVNGTCLFGCQDGYTGSNCSLATVGDDERLCHTLVCDVLLVVVCGLSALVAMIAMIAICCLCRRLQTQASPERPCTANQNGFPNLQEPLISSSTDSATSPEDTRPKRDTHSQTDAAYNPGTTTVSGGIQIERVENLNFGGPPPAFWPQARMLQEAITYQAMRGNHPYVVEQPDSRYTSDDNDSRTSSLQRNKPMDTVIPAASRYTSDEESQSSLQRNKSRGSLTPSGLSTREFTESQV